MAISTAIGAYPWVFAIGLFALSIQLFSQAATIVILVPVGVALVSVETANGDVTAEVRSVRGPVTVAAGNGDVELGIAPALDADLVASVANGAIETTGLDVAVERDTDRRFEGTLGDGGERIEVATGNGSVRLYALE